LVLGGEKTVMTEDDRTGPYPVMVCGVRSVRNQDCSSFNTDLVVTQSVRYTAGSVQNTKPQKYSYT
jgi:hypothetical protein